MSATLPVQSLTDYPGAVLRVFGPPGTGKTNTLSRRVRSTIAAYGPASVLIASFSKTAAHEIASRFGSEDAMRPPARAIGTLHSHAYRTCEHPVVALDRKVIADWNAQVEPELAITPDMRRVGGTEGGGAFVAQPENAATGDELLGALDRLRAGLVPREDWPANVRDFAKRWEDWKCEVGAIDFCMDEQSEIFTARGWLSGDELREGDLVRSIDPDTGMAEWQPVESVYRRRGRAHMIHLVNSVHDSMTTPDHRWLINRRDSAENWSREWTNTANLNSTARIIRAASSSDAPIEPKYVDAFVELVAWWFTEGSYSGSGSGSGGQIGQSHRANPAYTARIEACMRRLYGAPGLRVDGWPPWSVARSDKRGMTFFGLSGALVNELDAVAPDKVPSIEFLAQLTTAQVRLFVSTALDGDGHRRAQAWTFGQVDRRRTEAFAAAASLAGMSVTFARSREMKGTPYYEVTVSNRRLHAVVPGTTSGFATGVRLQVEYDGLIWCPTVAKHHNFFARRNGKTYYTGNTDMITGALERARDGQPPPGRPSRLIVDEAQDLTPLEVELALAWGRHTERLVFGMDDDQAINRWRGGDPEPLLALSGPEVQDDVLDQSYRVPEAVRAVAEQWVRRLSRRREKVYRPRVDEAGNQVVGAAYRVSYTLNSTTLISEAVREVDAGRDVMIIAACNYMLEALIKNLRSEGVPFHNPYRPGEARWNPLGRPSGEAMVTTAERIRRYLRVLEHDWTGGDIQAWIELVKLRDAGMRLGAKKAVAAMDSRNTVPFEEIAALFADARALELATEPSLDWLSRCLLKDKQGPAEYPIHLARTHGAAVLDQQPKIVVGTVHSIKGAAAQVVYVCPDISSAAARSMATTAGVDEAIRQFYVAMTRAYDELRILAPSTHQHLRADELIPSPLEVFPP